MDENLKVLLPNNILLLAYSGSISYGTYRPNSHPNSIDDKDVMGIAFGDYRDYLGFGHYSHTVIKQGEWDVTVYEIKRFFALLLKNNPNVMSLLWSPSYLITTPFSSELIYQRDIFSSKLAAKSYGGYAHDQLVKMKTFQREGYMGEKRKQLVTKFGYDTKNASHCIRLLRQGIFFLRYGIIEVQRRDAEELLEIKNGEWPIEKVQAEAEKLFAELKQAETDSFLPEQPNIKAAEKLLMRLLADYLEPFI